MADLPPPSDAQRRKLIKRLLAVRSDPARAAARGKLMRNGLLGLSFMIILAVFLLPQWTGLTRDIALIAFAVLASTAGYVDTNLRAMPASLQVIDWARVEQMGGELGVTRD